MRLERQRIAHLAIKAHAELECAESRRREQAIVESSAPAESFAIGGECRTWHEHEIECVRRNDPCLIHKRFADAELAKRD